MRVVIAGGSGLIGRNLTRRLLADGAEVTVLSRDVGAARRQLPDAVRVGAWDPSASDRMEGAQRATPADDAWAMALDGADLVVSLVGTSIGTRPWTARRKAELWASRIRPTAALVDTIGRLPPDRRPRTLLSISGTDLYEGRDDKPATEQTAPVDTFLGRLCLAWEAEALEAERLGVRVVVVRSSLVIARGAPAFRILTLPVRLGFGGRIGSGSQWMSWVALEDLLEIMVWAAGEPSIRGPINASAPDPRPQRAFVAVLARALRRPVWFPTPAWLVRLVLGELGTMVLGSRRVWPEAALSAGYEFRVATLEEAVRRATE